MPRPLRDKVEDDLIEETLRVFQPRTERRLTREDAREIAHNLTGFFKVLVEWDRREREKAAASGDDRG